MSCLSCHPIFAMSILLAKWNFNIWKEIKRLGWVTKKNDIICVGGNYQIRYVMTCALWLSGGNDFFF